MRGLQVGPDTVYEPYVIEPAPRRTVRLLAVALLVVVLASVARAGIEDGPDPIGAASRATKGHEITEDPAPVTTAEPLGWITIDMRPPAFAFNPQFVNPEIPRAVVPHGWGVKIIVRDPVAPESECNATQVKKCNALCGKQRQALASCEVTFEWQADGTCTRTLNCTCMSPGDPTIAGTVARSFDIKVRE